MKSKEALTILNDIINDGIDKGVLNLNGTIQSSIALETIEENLKILEILKNKKVDIKLVLWAGQKVEAYNVVVREKNLFPREELTQEEFDLIKEWLDNE